MTEHPNERGGDFDLSHRGTLSRTNLDQCFRDWREAIRFVRMFLAVHDGTGINGETCGKLARILLDAIYNWPVEHPSAPSVHPVDALKELAAQAGVELEPEQEAAMRKICDARDDG